MKRIVKIILAAICVMAMSVVLCCASDNNQELDFTDASTKYVSVYGLNVRSEYSSTCEIWDVLPHGSQITASSKIQNDYCLVGYEKNGTHCSGYVYASYLSDEKPTEEQAQASSSQGMTYLGVYNITGYDTCAKCCGKSDGITASGVRASVGRTVAMSGLPFGTKIYIEGIGYRTVEDRGVSGNKIDVLCSNHSQCYAITGRYKVYLVN